jgi:preprotein translocase subunit SecD
MAGARKGKIASLPAAIRDEVSTRLFDGQGAPQILPFLNKNPEVRKILKERWKDEDVSAQNLSEWRSGGFADWMRDNERIEATQRLAEYAFKLAQASGGSISEGAAAIAGGKILELLEKAAAADEDVKFGKDGEPIFKLGDLIDSLVSLRHTDIAQSRVKQNAKTLEQRDRALELEEKRFQRQTAELFIKFYDDKRAKEIMSRKGTSDVKVPDLVKVIFGERPKESSVPSLK